MRDRGQTVSTKTRREVLEAADWRCHYCGAWWASEVDHVRPVANDGTKALGNLAAVCSRCNYEKRDKTPAEWKAWRLERGMCWPPVDCSYVMMDVLRGLSPDELQDVDRATRAEDRRVMDVVDHIHDRYHAGKPDPLEADRTKLMQAVKACVAERDV